MLALTLQGKRLIKLTKVPRPHIVHPTDVVVKVTLCGICGSDLHPYHQRELGLVSGTIVGHEFVGVVVEAGAEVKQLTVGTRVMSPFTTNCGGCFYCQKRLTCRCTHPHAHLFGWVSEGEEKLAEEERRGLQGSQAQFVRVPLADSTLLKIPDDVSDEEGILLGDILSTAFFCAEGGNVQPGDTVAVVGCGPVGLLAVMAAQHLGAGTVFAVDTVPERLEFASRQLQATAVTATEAETAIRAATGGRGADVVLEVVGLSSALKLAFALLRPAGVLSSVGVHTDASFPFSPVDGYNKNITYRSGRCPARTYMEKLVPVVSSKQRDFTCIITHRLPLTAGEEAYEMFDSKSHGCIKVVLDPWA